MPTLGEELKRKREQRGITLAEIAEETRIGTRFLKAIETDNFSILPGGIFTRSFIRAYAKHVGMDEDQAIGLYLQQVAGPGVEEESDTASQITEQPPVQKVSKLPISPKLAAQPSVSADERSRRFRPVAFRPLPSRTSWSTIVIGGGIVVFIVIVVLLLVRQLNQGSSESGSHATSVAQENAGSNNATLAPPQAPAQPAAPEQPATIVSESSGQPLVVKVEAATGDSWIKYQVDDAKPTTLVLKQGQSQDLPPAQSQITLNYGNRLTLKLKINNRDANFPPETPKFASHVVISRDNFKTYFQ